MIARCAGEEGVAPAGAGRRSEQVEGGPAAESLVRVRGPTPTGLKGTIRLINPGSELTISTVSASGARPELPRPLKPRLSALPAWLRNVPFLLVHVACLGVFLTGVNTLALVLCGVCYFIRMFGITAGYHRYFAHRSYKTSRAFQFVMAWLGCSALQKGPLWWAAHHRHHHRYSDTPDDPHSPRSNSFWWSHVGWVLNVDSEDTQWAAIRDLSRYPELQFLNRNHWLPGFVLAVACFLIGGWAGLVWGFFVSTVLLYHAVFAVNSLCHIFGRRRYATTDDSRNNWFVALITLGEGWHNNHHYYQSSTNQGFFWWEVDVSYYLLRALSWCGLVWDLRKPPRKHLTKNRVKKKKRKAAKRQLAGVN